MKTSRHQIMRLRIRVEARVMEGISRNLVMAVIGMRRARNELRQVI